MNINFDFMNCAQVRGARPHSTTGVVHADDPAALSHWLKSISDNIVGLTNLQVNRECIDSNKE